MAPLNLSPKTVKDTHGAPAQPYRAVDTIETLLRRGTITREMAAAADKFREAFRAAHMDPLRAAEMGRVPGNYAKSRLTHLHGLDASSTRRWMRLGGEGSLAASAVWARSRARGPVSGWSESMTGLSRTDRSRGVLLGLGCRDRLS